MCICCDFVPATCPRYTVALHVASLCTTQAFCCCKMSVQRIKALEAVDNKNSRRYISYFFYSNFFVFLSSYFLSLGILWSLPGCKYAEFILIFGLLNIVTTLHNKKRNWTYTNCKMCYCLFFFPFNLPTQ